MFQEIYALYSACFPNYPVTKELFDELLKPEKAHLITRYMDGRLVGFSMIHGASVSLLCVDEAFRNRGIGTELMGESEQYIHAVGGTRVILGRGKYYLLQGVPTDREEVVSFFKKRGYSAAWTSTNMQFDLRDFSPEKLEIPTAPQGIEYRFVREADLPSLFEAIEEAKSAWVNVYKTCVDPIFVAVKDGRVVGFQVLAPTGGRFVGKGEKVGCIGCVGVVPAEREKGIGRQMVVKGMAWFKSQNCTSIELRYVEIVDWYRKIGFVPTRLQWMGEKTLG
ncbi:MAG: GNAT family N-acetyltransferase [Clostridia bacterium]|nr:GNAT family N-acetyltransferase [Clostridia bacterium]